MGNIFTPFLLRFFPAFVAVFCIQPFAGICVHHHYASHPFWKLFLYFVAKRSGLSIAFGNCFKSRTEFFIAALPHYYRLQIEERMA